MKAPVMTTKQPGFASEADLCAAFIDAATKGGKWRAYQETRGFDIVLARLPDFKAQHPTNYEQIKADREKWWPKSGLGEPVDGGLL